MATAATTDTSSEQYRTADRQAFARLIDRVFAATEAHDKAQRDFEVVLMSSKCEACVKSAAHAHERTRLEKKSALQTVHQALHVRFEACPPKSHATGRDPLGDLLQTIFRSNGPRT